MTDDLVLHYAQKALLAVDEIDKVSMARRSVYERRLEKALREARQALYKLVGTSDEISNQQT